LKGKPFENLVYRFSHRTGQRVILEGGGRPIFDDQHRVTGFRAIFRNITERVEAAGVIRESEEKYRYLVEQSLQGLAIVQDEPMQIVFANPAFAEMLGYAPDQLVGFGADSIRTILPPEDYDLLIERFGELIQGAPSFPRIIRMVRKDKDIRLVQVYGHRIEYQGRPAIQVYAIDFTEHKEVETEYRTLVEASPDSVMVTDLQGIILMVNQQTLKMYGYTREEMIGMNSLELVVPEDQPRAMRELQRLLQQRQITGVEYNARRKDGTIVPIELSAAPIMDPDGTPRALLAIGRDITERRETLSILQERQEQYRLLYENTVAGIFLVDNHGDITMCNAFGARLFGYTPTELAGKSFTRLIHPDDQDKVLHSFKDSITEGKTLELGLEARGLRKDGSTFFYHVTSTILKRDGEIDGVQAVILDITSMKEAQAKLQAEQDRIEFLNDLMVHDLINVNQGILSVLELQLRAPNLPEGAEELIELAVSQITRSTALIARMRRLSRIKSEVPQFEGRDVAASLQSAVESLEEELPAKTLQLATNIEAGKHIVLADSLLYDLFYNLLFRALQFTRQEEVQVSLMVGPAKSKEFLQILYKDQVPSSVEEDEKAYRLGRVTGDLMTLDLGICLTLVERIVTRYGGKVWAQESSPDSSIDGTTLIILLPKPK
jgi:PAS domain S-box-containing protein